MERLTIEQIASRVDAYYNKAMSLERGDLEVIDIAKMKLELTNMQSCLHEMKPSIKVTDFVKFNNICKQIIIVLNQHQNDAIQYYKTIRNAYRDRFGAEVYGEIAKSVKLSLGRE